MIRLTPRWKLGIRIALGVLVALDLALMIIVWRTSSDTPESRRMHEARLQVQAKLLETDVHRAEIIRSHLAQIGKQCDDFYRDQLPDSSNGYSVIEGDLNDLSTKAGLRTSLLGYRQKAVKDRGVVEVQITAAVEGDYNGMIQFINGLERSQNFYVLDNLAVTSGSTGASLKLNLTLRTYFRS